MLIYILPRLYEWTMRILHGQGLERRFKAIADLICSGTVLDIGCGPGLLASYLKDGVGYIGLDLNERFLNYMKAQGLETIRMNALDVEEYPPADHYVICDLLHHINPHHHEFVSKIAASGKTVIVCEPYLTSKSKLKRFMIRTALDYDFINPPRLGLSWYDEAELKEFLISELRASKVRKIGGVLLAFKKPSCP